MAKQYKYEGDVFSNSINFIEAEDTKKYDVNLMLIKNNITYRIEALRFIEFNGRKEIISNNAIDQKVYQNYLLDHSYKLYLSIEGLNISKDTREILYNQFISGDLLYYSIRMMNFTWKGFFYLNKYYLNAYSESAKHYPVLRFSLVNGGMVHFGNNREKKR